jgi:hypothetical protein
MLRRKVQAGVTLVLKVRVPEIHGVVAHNALHKGEVVEKDGTAQTPRYVNPADTVSLFYISRTWSYTYISDSAKHD